MLEVPHSCPVCEQGWEVVPHATCTERSRSVPAQLAGALLYAPAVDIIGERRPAPLRGLSGPLTPSRPTVARSPFSGGLMRKILPAFFKRLFSANEQELQFFLKVH